MEILIIALKSLISGGLCGCGGGAGAARMCQAPAWRRISHLVLVSFLMHGHHQWLRALLPKMSITELFPTGEHRY